MCADPLFVNEALGDVRLMPGSPCIDAGFPAGTEMGAFDATTGVSATTWGRIKASFAR